MLKVAVLDDYQNVFNQIINTQEFVSKYEFKIFNEPFNNELETIEALKNFEVLFLREDKNNKIFDIKFKKIKIYNDIRNEK